MFPIRLYRSFSPEWQGQDVSSKVRRCYFFHVIKCFTLTSMPDTSPVKAIRHPECLLRGQLISHYKRNTRNNLPRIHLLFGRVHVIIVTSAHPRKSEQDVEGNTRRASLAGLSDHHAALSSSRCHPRCETCQRTFFVSPSSFCFFSIKGARRYYAARVRHVTNERRGEQLSNNEQKTNTSSRPAWRPL